ncbi:uncharacterized protein DNG_09195 [Cephalotrichum gorgonifer]|uniref:AAA+ ATPase domain-containing protein n=1 Tax=Cephalotrichum gorgonifer TaxID=2041049 RepID=A0AAE8N810_9PEZI|nr:uncharacterized protein DNG_09195 [Cephalotrichum gorgonifer]
MAHKLLSSVLLPFGSLFESAASRNKEKKVEKTIDKVEDDDDDEDKPMQCEIKHLDSRYNDEDEQYFSERKVDVTPPEKKDWWRLFAFCMVREYDSDGDLDTTLLYVNPQPIRDLLNDVIGDYPGDPIDASDVRIDAPYHMLFYYRKELEAEGTKRFADDKESLAHLNLLLDWIKTHFKQEIAAWEKCMSGDMMVMSYQYLWTMFPPGTMAYMKIDDQDRVFRVNRCWYDDEDAEDPGLNISVLYVDFDGKQLGTRTMTGTIRKYSGSQKLTDLRCMPLDIVENAEEVRSKLLARGRKFERYAGQHFLQYSGIAFKKTSSGYARFSADGRVMIDCKTYHRLDPNDWFAVSDFKDKKAKKDDKDGKDEAEEQRPLTDEEALLANPRARGYSFTEKKFLEFSVDSLEDIQWNSDCFDSLVLDKSVKKTMQALVSVHSQERDTFDDIVKGKGQGLVCVLHGPPGVGKTLTAECVAEYVKRPLYMVSSGDLGISSTELNVQLTRIMDMAATWRAVLLIDEADVFLERRSLHDIHRNAMVSVFLRVLEYYSGILFLTTNRVTTFDDAFKSRIHIPIRYTDLSVDSRAEIWRNFCKRVPGGVDIDEKGIMRLAEHDLNGRQIKNVVKAAESLAAFDGVKIDLKGLEQVTKIQATFEKDLTNLSGIDYTAPGESKKDLEQRNMFL